MSQTINVLLADDHTVVRSGLVRLLQQNTDIKVIGEAENGEQAYRLYAELMPDVVIMDLSMPGMGGLDALKRITQDWPGARVIIYTMHENITYATQSMSAGAMGYVVKSGPTSDLINAVNRAFAGARYLSGEIAQKIALNSEAGDDDPAQILTARELEVFRLLAEGKAVEDIANQLGIGLKTVANHQTNIRQKLDIHSPVELIRLAIKHGVIMKS